MTELHLWNHLIPMTPGLSPWADLVVAEGFKPLRVRVWVVVWDSPHF